jgi:hypothetical protein
VGRLLLVAVILLLVAFSYRVAKDLQPGVRRRIGVWALGLVIAVALLFFFARFGLHWLAVIGAGALALLRKLFPLIVRALPSVAHFFRTRRGGAPSGAAAAEAGARPSGAGGPGGGRPPPRGGMSRTEALGVLGLEENATREQVIASYKNLMKKVHPDSPGGSDYLAKQINQAKDVLLG